MRSTARPLDTTLLLARQMHREHCFYLVGAHFDFAPMRLGNFTRDIQAEPEVAARVVPALMISAALERVENHVQGRSLDGRSAVPDREPHFPRLAGYQYTHRRVRRSVFDRIQN